MDLKTNYPNNHWKPNPKAAFPAQGQGHQAPNLNGCSCSKLREFLSSCHSKGFSRQLVRNADFQASAQNSWIRICILNYIPREAMCTCKSGKRLAMEMEQPELLAGMWGALVASDLQPLVQILQPKLSPNLEMSCGLTAGYQWGSWHLLSIIGSGNSQKLGNNTVIEIHWPQILAPPCCPPWLTQAPPSFSSGELHSLSRYPSLYMEPPVSWR